MEGKITEQKTNKWDDLGQNVVSGALDDTKKMREAGADIFATSGPEKNPKNRKQSKHSSGSSPFFVWT